MGTLMTDPFEGLAEAPFHLGREEFDRWLGTKWIRTPIWS
jgi:hypothetical protein